jgi:hypothetical protein
VRLENLKLKSGVRTEGALRRRRHTRDRGLR